MNLSDYINLLYFISIRLKHKGYVECKEVTSNRIAKAHASKLKNVKEAILFPKRIQIMHIIVISEVFNSLNAETDSPPLERI